jgi:hypothetical protein
MRKLLAFLLLAGAATPALAAADPGDNNRIHADREARREARAEARAERSGGNDRQHSNNLSGGVQNGSSNSSGGPPPQAVVHVETNGGNGGGNQAGEQRFHHGIANRVSDSGYQVVEPAQQNEAGASETVRRWHGPKVVEPTRVTTEDRVAPTLRRQDRPVPGVFRNRVPVVSNVPHEGTQPPLRALNRDREHHWSTNWRSDQRYDWQDWRRHHRSHFHLGFYYDPFGWSYRPYSIGWRLWPSYYSSRYWINDPWEYRLPYAPPGYRWIRYWDDALLVDTWTGEVVDVIPNFFW